MMREDWIEYNFNDVTINFDGKRKPLSRAVRKGFSGKYPYYGACEIIDYVKEYLFDGDYLLIGEDGANLLSKSKPLSFIASGKFWVNNHAHVVQTKQGINLNFLNYQFNALQINKFVTGTAQPKLNQRNLNKIPISVPPLPEQRAIVTKINELFSSLDSGIADLKKAQDQLKVYRQAVLKKAFEGELTKEWREKQADLPSAEELEKQITEEREKYYQNQLKDWEKAVEKWEKNKKEGKKPRKPKAIKTVEEFTEIEIANMDQLPNNWRWVKLGNIFAIYVGSTPSRTKEEYWKNGSINWVSSGEVTFTSITEAKEKITTDGLNNTSTTVHPKGTVMLAMIGEGKTRGQAGILEIEACHNQNTAAIRVSEVGLIPKFLFHYLFLKYQRNRNIGSGNNQKALNQSRIMDFDYPLCSIVEQHQIVKEIESRLSVCDHTEQSISESLEKSKALRQGILKKAFDGTLLSEVEIEKCKRAEDYEPASVLLERIKKEKAN